MSRIKNTVRNIRWGLINQVVVLVFPFLIRTINLRIFGEEILGLHSLFISILNILNLAELGFSSAIVFSMYEPIAKKNQRTICALLAFYKKTYSVIGFIVLVLGIIIMPFLRHLIKGPYPSSINIYMLYAILLANSVLSYYLFAYKNSLLIAHHRNDMSSKISLLVGVLQYSVQIGLLYILRNYYFYLLTLPIFTIISNIFINIISKKYYPEYVCCGKLEDNISRKIKKQIRGVMISKICGTLRNSLDSIIISVFIGLATVTKYSNYFFILNAVHGFLIIIGVSMKAGVGNSIINESEEKNFHDFEKFTFFYAYLAGWSTCCLISLYQPFMFLWTQNENLVFTVPTMVLFCIYFFCLCMTDIRNVYMDSVGLWWEARYRAIAESVGNLLLNILLGYLFGVNGILTSTLLTLIVINLIYGTKILFSNYFTKESCPKYLWSLFQYFILVCIASALSYLVCGILNLTGYANLIIRLFISTIMTAIVFLFFYRNSIYVKDFFLICSRISEEFWTAVRN